MSATAIVVSVLIAGGVGLVVGLLVGCNRYPVERDDT